MEIDKIKKRYQGDGFDVTEEDGIYRMSWEQGPFGVIKEYEISKENFEKAMKSSKDAYEVSVYAQTGFVDKMDRTGQLASCTED